MRWKFKGNKTDLALTISLTIFIILLDIFIIYVLKSTAHSVDRVIIGPVILIIGLATTYLSLKYTVFTFIVETDEWKKSRKEKERLRNEEENRRHEQLLREEKEKENDEKRKELQQQKIIREQAEAEKAEKAKRERADKVKKEIIEKRKREYELTKQKMEKELCGKEEYELIYEDEKKKENFQGIAVITYELSSEKDGEFPELNKPVVIKKRKNLNEENISEFSISQLRRMLILVNPIADEIPLKKRAIISKIEEVIQEPDGFAKTQDHATYRNLTNETIESTQSNQEDTHYGPIIVSVIIIGIVLLLKYAISYPVTEVLDFKISVTFNQYAQVCKNFSSMPYCSTIQFLDVISWVVIGIFAIVALIGILKSFSESTSKKE